MDAEAFFLFSTMKHTCDAFVASCIDFRFQKYIREWLDVHLKDKTFDYVGFAGGAKDIETILKQLAISVRLHNIKRVILMNHEECGAYGNESTPENHARDLRKAKKEILVLYPTLSVSLYYLHLDGEFEEIRLSSQTSPKQYLFAHHH
ncbi:MAG TPA: carbonic anhydrase [Patescibacteria group bacterium]|nr:carbonic anhydrase [Patescibacteria group bacterium]